MISGSAIAPPPTCLLSCPPPTYTRMPMHCDTRCVRSLTAPPAHTPAHFTKLRGALCASTTGHVARRRRHPARRPYPRDTESTDAHHQCSSLGITCRIHRVAPRAVCTVLCCGIARCQGSYVPADLWNPPIGAAHWVHNALARDARVREARISFLTGGFHTSTVDIGSVNERPRGGDDLFLGLLRVCPSRTVDGHTFC
jgi:hypothetical protein